MAPSPPPLSSLRLLVPPLRLMSAAMWTVARHQSVGHYGMLEDFVALVTEAVPHILTDRQRGLLLLALRAKMTQDMFGDDLSSDPEPQAVQRHLDQIKCVSLTMLIDRAIMESTSNLVSLTQRLVEEPEERGRLLQEAYNSSFDAALQSLICDFLSRLDQLFPVPGFKQAACWLDAAPGGLEECLQEAESSSEELRALLANNTCQHKQVTTTVGSFAEELLLTSLSRPSPTKPTNPYLPIDTPDVQSHPLPDWVSHAHLVREEVVETEGRAEEEERKSDASETRDEEGAEQEGGGGMEQEGGGATEQEVGGATEQEEDVAQQEEETVCPPQKKSEDEPSGATTQPHLVLSELDRLCASPCHPEDTHTVDQSDEPCSEAPPTADSAPEPLANISHNGQRIAHKCPQCGKCFIYRSQVIRHLRTHKPRGGSAHACPRCGRSFRTAWSLSEHKCAAAAPPGGDPPDPPDPSAAAPLSCLLCGKTSRTAREQQRHRLTHRANACFQCGTGFKGKAELAAHLRSHRARPLHQCAQCGKHFRLLSSLTNHRQTHAAAGGFACTKCERVFGTARERDAHRQMHRMAKLPCPACGEAFTSQAKLLKHQQLSHPAQDGQETRFSCRFCDHSFTSLTQLRIHQRSHMPKTFPCDQCDKAFGSPGGLQSHKGTHSGEKPYLCTHCGKCFRTKDGLEGHQRIHTGEKPHRCSYCGKSFTALAGLNVHVRRHTGERPYVCQVCGKGWPSGGDLQKHMRCHTGERPYVCQECGKAFSISCHLTEHIRSHTGEKPYTCPECGKSLKRKFDLKKHMLSHSDVRPYPCSFCPKSYTRRTHLNRHLQTHVST